MNFGRSKNSSTRGPRLHSTLASSRGDYRLRLAGLKHLAWPTKQRVSPLYRYRPSPCDEMQAPLSQSAFADMQTVATTAPPVPPLILRRQCSEVRLYEGLRSSLTARLRNGCRNA